MRAILLAAGFGSRLRPLTDNTPKCLVKIGGKPLLQIWLERLTDAGIGPFLINTHYLSEQVEDFIEKSDFRDMVELAYEPELLGTAGTVCNNIDFFKGQDALLVHADNYCLADFKEFVDAHKQRPLHCAMTMMTFRTDAPSLCGIVELDKFSIVTEFYEKNNNPPGNLANGAIYILSAALVKKFKVDFQGLNDFSTDILHRLLGKIYTYETPGVLIDIGSPESLQNANNLKNTLLEE